MSGHQSLSFCANFLYPLVHVRGMGGTISVIPRIHELGEILGNEVREHAKLQRDRVQQPRELDVPLDIELDEAPLQILVHFQALHHHLLLLHRLRRPVLLLHHRLLLPSPPPPHLRLELPPLLIKHPRLLNHALHPRRALTRRLPHHLLHFDPKIIPRLARRHPQTRKAPHLPRKRPRRRGPRRHLPRQLDQRRMRSLPRRLLLR
mmetsp:Transcript_28297/g.70968  ORF Transcript_28297/g.70968 Transcript_28297/m.70968 type:complete len:205 (+) Transcript_28297:233-847(+)